MAAADELALSLGRFLGQVGHDWLAVAQRGGDRGGGADHVLDLALVDGDVARRLLLGERLAVGREDGAAQAGQDDLLLHLRDALGRERRAVEGLHLDGAHHDNRERGHREREDQAQAVVAQSLHGAVRGRP